MCSDVFLSRIQCLTRRWWGLDYGRCCVTWSDRRFVPLPASFFSAGFTNTTTGSIGTSLSKSPNDRTSIRWTCYKAMFNRPARDFVIRTSWEEFADGTIVINTQSVEHKDYLVTSHFARGEMVRLLTVANSKRISHPRTHETGRLRSGPRSAYRR